jgi:hypothetical protein
VGVNDECLSVSFCIMMTDDLITILGLFFLFSGRFQYYHTARAILNCCYKWRSQSAENRGEMFLWLSSSTSRVACV